eukprot:m51a1_g2065 hypothetical protein (1092) ;mRNA; r:1435595-1440755
MKRRSSIRCFGFKLGLGSLCVALIAGSVIVSVVPQWVVWYVQANASTRGVSRDLIRQIASKVMVALEFTISQAEQITSELTLIAESSPDACSDDVNASAAVVQGRWRDYFNKARITEREGWAIVAGDRFGTALCIYGTPAELQTKPLPELPFNVSDVVVNRTNGSIDIGTLKSSTPSFNVFTRPWYADPVKNPGNMTWGRFFIGIPSGRQLIAVSKTHGSLKEPNRVCDGMTRDIGHYVTKLTSGGGTLDNDTHIVSIGGVSCQVLVSLINIRPDSGFAPMYYVVAVPVDDYWGAISRGIVVTIIVTVVLFMFSLMVAIVAGIALVSRPLIRTSKTISRLSCLNMEDLAYVSGHPIPSHSGAGALVVAKSESEFGGSATRTTSSANDGSLSRFGGNVLLSEVSDLLTSASKMAESLYAVGRYVSMDLCSWVIQNRVVEMPLAPKVITALFCDIQGSTAMIDRSKREGTMGEFGRMLNEILTTLANVAKRHGGYIDKLMGDEVMAIFNAPYECKDHQVHACAAALKMRDAVAELCHSWDELGLYRSFPRPRVRIGVAAGEVLIGDIGAFGTLTNFTAIGDTVCIAARLQSAAKVIDPESTGILLTGDTWIAACAQEGGDNLVVRTVGCIKLRGPDLPMLVSTVIGTRNKFSESEIEATKTYNSAMELFYNCEWAECIEMLRRVDSASIPRKDPNEKKVIYVYGTIRGDDLGNGQYASEEYYRNYPRKVAFFYDLYAHSMDQNYMNQLKAKAATGSKADKDLFDLARRQNGFRPVFQNNQKAQISFNIPPNTSIIGVGNARFEGATIMISSVSNVVIRNIFIEAPLDFGPSCNGGEFNARYDAISVISSTGIWLDHLTLTDGRFTDDKEKYYPFLHMRADRHDGLIDIEDGSDFITISRCVLANHSKTSMIVSGDDKGAREHGKERITFFANVWSDAMWRCPFVRYGKVHVLANYNTRAQGYGDIIQMGVESMILSEKNAFEHRSPQPNKNLLIGPSKGYQLRDVGSWFNGVPCTDDMHNLARQGYNRYRAMELTAAQRERRPAESWASHAFTTNIGWVPPYKYDTDAYTSAQQVKDSALASAGAGKLRVQAN